MKSQLQDIVVTSPLDVPLSVRPDNARGLSSGRAGVVQPLHYIPVLREDKLSGSFRLNIKTREMPRLLANPINVEVRADFVPFLAFERFGGSLDKFNDSYIGRASEEGGTPIPFFKMENFVDGEFWRKMGVHAAAGAQINNAPKAAYNVLVNHLRRLRSSSLPQREEWKNSLARAFWLNTDMSHIVPRPDMSMIDGEIPLNFAAGQLPVKLTGSAQAGTANHYLRYDGTSNEATTQHGGEIFAELQEQNVVVSLANIELAKKTAAFARMRKRYSALEDDDIIDLLMEGIRVPDEALTQPILLDRKRTILGYSQRYATDAANLDTMVSQGVTSVDLRYRLPAMNTGGVVIFTVQVVPDPMFERQKDYFLAAKTSDDLPNAIRDGGEVYKVERLQNDHADVLHSDPEGTFGYAPLNVGWHRDRIRIGGEFYRNTPTGTFDENRARFWSPEIVDPQLTEDWWLVPDGLNHDVFADNEADSFEYQFEAQAALIGRTVFGDKLFEAADDYERILDIVDSEYPEVEPEEGA